MASEGNIALAVRNQWMDRRYVLGRDHSSSCDESVDEQKVCPRKGA